jgi:hypothetical protein
VRAEAARDIGTGPAARRTHEVHVADVEEAILQTHVDVLADRSANAGQNLPRKAGVRIVEDAGRGGHTVVDLGNADAAADEALEAVVGTEVDQGVAHEAERAGVTGDFAIVTVVGDARAVVQQVVGLRAAIAAFGFEAEATEVVTDDAAEVVAGLAVVGCRVAGAVDLHVGVFLQHYAAIAFNVPALAASKGRRRQCA